MPSSLTVYKEVQLPAAPALLYNNIVVHRNGEYVSYATPTALVSVQTATGTPCFHPLEVPSDTCAAFLAGVTDPSVANVILVAALANSTALVLVNGQLMHTVNAKVPAETFTCVAVTRVANSEEMLVVLGGSMGSIEATRYTLQGKLLTVTSPSLPVQAHERRSITALDVRVAADAAGAVEVASGDKGGHVVLWKAGNPTLCFPPADATDAVTSVRWLHHEGRVAVAYGGGRIKVVDSETGATVVVIEAHSRWINAMGYNEGKRLLVSAAEDGQIFIWNLNAATPDDVCVARGSVANEMLTGVAMMGAHCAVIQLSYDVPKLRLMSCS
ncbi:hypothetical protein ABL78_5565 [Leptomonas seymouri]|uniref:WD repeat-containing protein 54 beta-propeller domain-containing protein n=1 Tax=Leptomonas seymouri TaxID=5684 RepID=A0A0N1IJR4_LEPSE|nr:hypothetical protein ABL78_5565 [Leptomonas seymouri]|eukprot:KPI85384.1 hypothetical protein ABL78_5565 [Leptomonas seymouri]